MIRTFGDPQHPGKGADNGNIRTKDKMKQALATIAQYRQEIDTEF